MNAYGNDTSGTCDESFGRYKALDDVSIVVEEGEF